jgi:hypothetical protein
VFVHGRVPVIVALRRQLREAHHQDSGIGDWEYHEYNGVRGWRYDKVVTRHATSRQGCDRCRRDASTVQLITFMSVSHSHSFPCLNCSFPRKPRCTERGDGCADLAMSRVSLNLTKGEEVDVLQHKLFLLITRADTNSHQESSTSPMNARKRM